RSRKRRRMRYPHASVSTGTIRELTLAHAGIGLTCRSCGSRRCNAYQYWTHLLKRNYSVRAEIGLLLRITQEGKILIATLGSTIMIRIVFLMFLAAVLLSGATADTPPSAPEPEYYYTRVIYTGVGTPERGGPAPYRYPPIRNFKCSDLERGEGGLGGGWR